MGETPENNNVTEHFYDAVEAANDSVRDVVRKFGIAGGGRVSGQPGRAVRAALHDLTLRNLDPRDGVLRDASGDESKEV